MIGIVVVGHINFASGIQSAVEAIVGEQPQIRFIDFLPSTSAEQLQQHMADAVAECQQGQGVLLMTDVMGGTPCNRAIALLANTPNITVVTGSNLPMIANACLERDELTLEQLVEFVISLGHQSISEVQQVDEEEETPDLIDDGL